MEALVFFSLLLIGGTWLVGDGWFSILHYKGKGESFWSNHIFRAIRIGWAITFVLMAWWFAWRMF